MIRAACEIENTPTNLYKHTPLEVGEIVRPHIPRCLRFVCFVFAAQLRVMKSGVPGIFPLSISFVFVELH